MNIIIIEDEKSASARLADMLIALDPTFNIEVTLESVEETVAYLSNNKSPQLAFMDIQLADDVSFEIFNKIDVSFPIIFTTAYDNYVLEALEHNSIDYLLKPIAPDRLMKAIDKVKRLENHFVHNKFASLLSEKKAAKSRFLVKKGTEYVSLSTPQIAYFFTEHKIVFLKDKSSNKYIIDKTITELQEQLDTKEFFRINRKYIACIDAIKSFKPDNGKILLTLEPPSNEDVYISKENAPNFRKWIER
ncbi:MAG TPA: LytTR family DNA-binding domain-containing protein [Fulvivirga sp.]|nr:LytTR family DNA-binding domain-containing protein [Fulvivirga sp.]